MNIDLIIADVDGTLLNTNDAVVLAQAQTLSQNTTLSIEEAIKELFKLGLKNTVNKYMNMNLDTFLQASHKHQSIGV